MAKKIIFAFGLLVIAFHLAAAEDPFSGFWRLNLAKSNLPPPLPKSQTSLIEATAEKISVKEEVINEKGEVLVITGEARFDGKDYPVHGTPFADTIAYERIDARTLKGWAKKGGKIVTRETVTVSPDGKTLTGSYSGTDATGKQVTATAVFDKQ